MNHSPLQVLRKERLGLPQIFLIWLIVGFVAACQPQNTTKSSPVETAITDETAEQHASSTDAKPQEPGAQEITQPEQNTLFDEYDFSTVEEARPATTNENIEPFCLGEIASPDSKEAAETIALKACERIAKRLASVSMQDCKSAALQLSQCESVNEFPILYREFAPVADRKPQGRILVIGGTHGDELTSVSIVFRWIEKLNRFHSGLFHWHMVPMMNPDGVLKRAASRTNANGVDLNRNLPSDDWQEKAIKYWQDKTGSNARRYPGEQPASEPETQWLIDEIESFKPDAIISVHAPYGVVDFDAQLLNTAPKSLGRLRLNLLGTYPGSLGNYAGINRDIPVITLELPHAWEMPSEKESTKIWEDIVSWLRKNVGKNAS